MYEKSDYRYRVVPMIRPDGNWLKTAGFDVGDITVECEDGKLIIEMDTEKAKLKETERAFRAGMVWKLVFCGNSIPGYVLHSKTK